MNIRLTELIKQHLYQYIGIFYARRAGPHQPIRAFDACDRERGVWRNLLFEGLERRPQHDIVNELIAQRGRDVTASGSACVSVRAKTKFLKEIVVLYFFYNALAPSTLDDKM